jgi:alpha-L-fucosidase 2
MKPLNILTVALFSLHLVADVAVTQTVSSNSQAVKPLVLRYNKPAPDSDLGWVNDSVPLGNGYMGANVFGGVETERIQITENSLYDWGRDRGLKRRGLNNFAEVYLDFDHGPVSQYQRALDLGEGVSYVTYKQDAIEYSREYFTSYPDKVMVIRMGASKKGALSFTLRPTIPFLGEGKSGTVKAAGDTVTLSGEMTYYKILFEGQVKVISTGGTIQANSDKGTIKVSGADEALVLIAVGTNYQIDSQVFLENQPKKKLAGFEDPHAKVSQYIRSAAAKSYAQLKASHQADYQNLFDRVHLDLGAALPDATTDTIVDAYPGGQHDRYLEELAFQFGRYMLICSSRKDTLPPHLQGIWNVYARPPWSSQYLHDTNVQMAYAPVFSANLPELFESYADFFIALEPRQRKYATKYVREFNPSQLDPQGNNGWSGPFWANPYNIAGKSPIAGFGTGSWIAQMFWDYYDYTRDETVLAEMVYPVMYEQANFVSRFVQEIDGALLAKPSSSPEQKLRNTIGTTFDQQMFYENHHNTLIAAKILGRSDSRLELFEKQLPQLDPIQIGKSGQIKEFRQEEYYGEIGDPQHRHTSMLLGQYPGQLINDATPAWLDAVKVSLQKRTNKSHIGWARAERIAFWARVHDGDEAYSFYQDLLEGNFLHNLFNDHRGGPLFQADANYGATAGVAEMLMQSQDYIISPLTALPSAWPTGSYRGLLARGNFEVSAAWEDGKATRFEVRSKSGGKLKFRYPNIAKAKIETSAGVEVAFAATGDDLVSIETTQGQAYTFSDLVGFTRVPAPSGLQVKASGAKGITLAWNESIGSTHYKLYRAIGNAAVYEMVQSDIKEPSFVYQPDDLANIKQVTLKVTAVKDDRESNKGSTTVWLAKPRSN